MRGNNTRHSDLTLQALKNYKGSFSQVFWHFLDITFIQVNKKKKNLYLKFILLKLIAALNKNRPKSMLDNNCCSLTPSAPVFDWKAACSQSVIPLVVSLVVPNPKGVMRLFLPGVALIGHSPPCFGTFRTFSRRSLSVKKVPVLKRWVTNTNLMFPGSCNTKGLITTVYYTRLRRS